MARILMVDDDVALLEVWAGWLREIGHTVQTATDGVEAIKQIGRAQYDILTFDLNMPRLNGLEAIKLIRRTDPDLPILAITGMPDPAMVQAVRDAGVNEILFKPVLLENLMGAIKRVEKSTREK